MWQILIIFIIVLAVLTQSQSTSTINDKVLGLYRQAARYAIAASQDQSPAIAVLHANYGMGYALALRDLVTTEEFKKITGISLSDFEQRIGRIQDAVTLRLVNQCESLIPDEDPVLLKAMYF